MSLLAHEELSEGSTDAEMERAEKVGYETLDTMETQERHCEGAVSSAESTGDSDTPPNRIHSGARRHNIKKSELKEKCRDESELNAETPDQDPTYNLKQPWTTRVENQTSRRKNNRFDTDTVLTGAA